MPPSFQVSLSAEVQEALANKRAVVALESTIISHGLPYPENIETAKALENIIREKGAVPATIAVIDGIARAGLSPEELDLLSVPASNILKLSRRDLPFAFSQKKHGATTVAATMVIAAVAGIHVFATGGIGGVHRGAEQDFDISADLSELARSNVAVICAGPKAILNIPATLEVLETASVPVIGYRCDEMPAFWSRRSSAWLDCRLDSPAEIADLCLAKWQSGLSGGVLIANPVPADDEIEARIIEDAIEHALGLARKQGIKGKALTPFLLENIRHITEGASLKTNTSLVKNNAALAADIALAMVG